jgi:ribonuclease BN (tRNA processing enzyme)
MQIVSLGIGNAFTTRSFHTSLVLLAGDTRVLIDCPSPLGRILREASEISGLSLSSATLDHLILTHLHADHMSGLEEYLYTRRYIANSPEKPHLYTLAENIQPLWERRLALSFADTFNPDKAGTCLDDLFHVHPIDPEQPISIGGMEFTFRRTRHSIPTVGFVARHGQSRFGYSSDTPFDSELIAFLAEADLIFHEAGDGDSHTPIESLAALPAPLRDKIRLVHLPDNLLLDPPTSPIPAITGHVYTLPMPPKCGKPSPSDAPL